MIPKVREAKRTQVIAILVGLAAMLALSSPAHARLYMMMQGSNVYPGVATPMPPMPGGYGAPHIGVNVYPSVPTPMPHPDGPNLYQYVRSNPIRYVDWNGQQATQPGMQPSSQPEEPTFPDSPAGGPTKHPNAVVCRASYATLQVTCSLKEESVSCPIVGNSVAADQKTGRTPPGEYLIDEKRTHPRYKIDWYNLHPKLEDNSGYYGYGATTKGGRTTMGLHPGCVTEGCVTVNAGSYRPYDSDPCWKRLSALIDKGSITYTSSRKPSKKQTFSGFLWVD